MTTCRIRIWALAAILWAGCGEGGEGSGGAGQQETTTRTGVAGEFKFSNRVVRFAPVQ